MDSLLDITRIYYEPAAAELARGREILDRFPSAERIAIESHWRLSQFKGDPDTAANWLPIKRHELIVGIKKSLSCRPNTRSSDFIAPSVANGCAMACAYCYVPRRKGYANPITLFANIEAIRGYLSRHAARQGPKREANQIDPSLWVYDIGENSDCSVDALLCENVRDLVNLFRGLSNAKASFATKYVNREMLSWDPAGKSRIRFSLMPPRVARVVDVRTSAVAERIAAINDFVDAGWEVHLNFSPVIYYEGWVEDYRELFDELDDCLSPRTKAQLAAEVIFLTHNDRLHEINLAWHPRAEELLWTPELQEQKYSQTGGRNVRYRRGFKGGLVDTFCSLLTERLPSCRIRYAF